MEQGDLSRNMPVCKISGQIGIKCVRFQLHGWESFGSHEHDAGVKANSEPELKTWNCLLARARVDAPDIDGRVYVRGKPRSHEAVLPIGKFAGSKSSDARITI
jgi:hypothetical protein